MPGRLRACQLGGMPQVSNAILFGTVLAPVALSTEALRDRGSGADSFADVREGPEEETRAGEERRDRGWAE
jgi:hypothetical protein